MMKRFIIGMLILGGIIAAAAVIMKRRSGSDVGWDEFARDTSARMSDAVERGSDAAKDAAGQPKDADTVVDLTEEGEHSTS
jgi:hypothetical protein